MDKRNLVLVLAMIFVFAFFVILAVYGVLNPDEAVCLLCGME